MARMELGRSFEGESPNVELSAAEAGWVMTATWSHDQWSAGPREVLFTLAGDAPQGVRERGLTTGIARRLLNQLTALTDSAQAGDDPRDDERSELESRCLSLAKRSPRSDTDYYADLLEAYFLAKRCGPQPNVYLATLLKVPRGTITTRLDVARRRYPDRVRDSHRLASNG